MTLVINYRQRASCLGIFLLTSVRKVDYLGISAGADCPSQSFAGSIRSEYLKQSA